MRLVTIVLLVASACGVAACSSGHGSAKAPTSTTGTVPTAPTTGNPSTTTGAVTPSLTGTLWSLRSVGTKTVPANVDVTATFAHGTVSGSSGCNSYNAPYTLAGARMTIGAALSTKMACPPPQMPIERAYLAALPEVQRFDIDRAGSLILTRRDSSTLVYVEQEQTVVGSWNVTGYLQHDGNAFTSVLAGTTVTARFDSLDKVSGSSGCNSYGGAYAVHGTTIAMGPFSATAMACGTPNGVMTQESDFLAAMRASKTFLLSGDTLTLLDGRQRRSVTMRRAPTS